MAKELSDEEKFYAATMSLQEGGYFDDRKPLEKLLPADDWRLIAVKKYRELHKKIEHDKDLRNTVKIKNLFHEVGIEDKVRKAIILRRLGASPINIMNIVGMSKYRYTKNVMPRVPRFGHGSKGEDLGYVAKQLEKYLSGKGLNEFHEEAKEKE